MSVIIDHRDFLNRDCDCNGTGYHRFEPYDNEFSKMLKINELIEDLEKLIDDIKEWRRDAI